MNQKQKAYIYLLITTSAWGSLYVAGKFVVESIPAFTLLFIRYAIGAAILYYVYRRGEVQKIEKKDLKYFFAIGAIGYFSGIGLQLAAIQYCDASLASLINSTNPVVIILVAIPVLKERATLHKVIAVAITMAGAGIIIGNIEGKSAMFGVILSLGAVITWSIASVLVRLVSKKYDSLTITLYGMSTAVVLAFPVSTYELIKNHIGWSVVTPSLIAAILYIGIVCTSLALFLWNKALSLVDAATCSLFYPVQPMVSTLLGVLFLGEIITVNFIIGGIFIIAGILYSILTDMDKSSKIGQRNAEQEP